MQRHRDEKKSKEKSEMQNVTRDEDESFFDDGSRTLKRALHENDSSSDPGVALLREIFPGQSEEELRQLHIDRLKSAAAKKKRPPPLTSKLGQRIWNLLQEKGQPEPPRVALPDEFLRIPQEIQCHTSQWQNQLMNQLEQRVLQQHREYQATRGPEVAYPLDGEYCYTRSISKDVQLGLGITLCEEGGCIWVHSLLAKGGTRCFRTPPDIRLGGPALRAGIQPGDWVLGIQGEALIPTNQKNFLRHAVSCVQRADDPVVMHLQHVPLNGLHPLSGSGPSLLDTTAESLDTSMSEEPTPDFGVTSYGRPLRRVHPFVRGLVSKGLIQRETDELDATKCITQFTERARHWESTSSFRIDSHTFELRFHFDPRDLPPSLSEGALPYHYDEAMTIHPYAPSTPTLDPYVDRIPAEYLNAGEGKVRLDDVLSEQHGLLGFDNDQVYTHIPSTNQTKAKYPGARLPSEKARPRPFLQPSDVFIPLMGVRKALCVRILNTFIEENRTAYTIWVYDVESGREWYAPVRYLRDFQELRSATAPLCASIYRIPFPSGGWRAFGVNEKSEPDSVRDEKCHQLENFLRRITTLVYTDPLHPGIAEIAIHVQSFLGCDAGLSQGGDSFLRLQNPAVINEPMCGQKVEKGHSIFQMNVRLRLKRSIQRYTYRLFLLNIMKQIVDDFVSETWANGPTLNEIEVLEAQGRTVLKERALRYLERIQDFLDQIQDLILEGCAADVESIARRRDFVALRKFIDGKKGNDYVEKIVREAVREQVEIEVYVPLRSVVSRLLVNGWKHDDMEINFKMQVSSCKATSCLVRMRFCLTIF
jgi:hypothetical protein